MPAYVIADITITDPAGYEEYKRLTPGSIASFGGRFIARGGQVDVLEGDWAPERLVILEFPSLEQAQAWYDSPGYQEAKAIRQRTARGRLIVVDGGPPG